MTDPTERGSRPSTETSPETQTATTERDTGTTTETMTDANRDPTTDAEPDTEYRTPGYKPTLGDVSHTNPYTNEVFGETQTYGRGKIVAADGGAADRADAPNPAEQTPDNEPTPDGGREAERDGEPDAERDADGETLEDVDHTPAAEDVDGTQGSFDRGREGADDRDDE